MPLNAGRTVLDIGDLALPDGDDPPLHPIERDFSGSISLVVLLAFEAYEPEHAQVQWGLYDSVDDGNHWWSVEDTRGEHHSRWLGFPDARSSTRRFRVPFGPLLAIGLKTRLDPSRVAYERQRDPRAFRKVRATLFWREG